MNPPTTLVIEDDATNRKGLVRLLQYAGLLVDSASTVAEAIAKIRDRPPAIVLLDIHLPDGSGDQILDHLRATRSPARVCIITGSIDSDERRKLERFGPDAIFIKPIYPERVLEWVNEIREAMS